MKDCAVYIKQLNSSLKSPSQSKAIKLMPVRLENKRILWRRSMKYESGLMSGL